MGVDAWRIGEAKDRVGLPVAAFDAVGAELYSLQDGPARGLDRAALELIAHAVETHDATDVGGDGEAAHDDPVDGLDLGDHGAVGAAVLVAGVRDAPADVIRTRLAPAAALGGQAYDRRCA